MKTPIYDFLESYAEKHAVRLHMPGHKGAICQNVNNSSLFSAYNFDITEISGADSLYEADGIIKESEKLSSALFGADTFYSTEGSSLSIRTMLYLVALYAIERGERPRVLAARNVHKSFISAIALLDIDVTWLFGEGEYLSCKIEPESLERALTESEDKPSAVYLTSPDYLGNIQDVKALSEICHKHGVMLLVDNAHGAYLKFLKSSCHPIDLGADMCADSAHKTLPVLTGGAYLHLSKSLPPFFKKNAKTCMAMFASSSPSYLILASLDLVNACLPDFSSFEKRMAECKGRIQSLGYTLISDEPAKITICAKKYGYLGTRLAKELSEQGIECEFADPDFVVLMLSPMNTEEDIERLLLALNSIPKREEIKLSPPRLTVPKAVTSPRAAAFSPTVTASVDDSVGRVVSAVTVGCPPAVPILVAGEAVTEEAIEVFKYYGIEKINLVK